MDAAQAADHLRTRLPEFAPVLDEHLKDDEELLLHPLMGDLGRFYMARIEDEDLRARYWNAVELMASGGDELVKSAVQVSLVEWFLASPGDEADAFAASRQLHGPTTGTMASHYPLK